MSESRPKVLILGLDGVGPDLVEQLGESGGLPHLQALRARGAWGRLSSTNPPTTLPAWTSFMTGAPPSFHGVPDFTVRHGYRVRFVGAALRALPTVFEHLESYDLRVGAAWFPATYPPEPLNGFMISGWDSPVTSAGDRSFVYPRELHETLKRRFGGDHLAFDSIDEFRSDANWYRRAADALVRSVERRARVALWLLRHQRVDVAAFYFGETDTVAHHFWAFHDPRSPRRPATFDPSLAPVLGHLYRAVDRAVGDLVEAAGPDAAVVVLSDHGSGGSSDIALHLNRMLEQAGLLTFTKKRSRLIPGTGLVRGVGPSLLPKGLRRPLFRFAGGVAPTLLESHLRFGGIDFSRTRVFSEELTYAPSLWFNLHGREPRGIVPKDEVGELFSKVEAAATKVRGPGGEPLIKRVIRRDELHLGPLAHLFPDIVLELERPNGYTPACVPSQGRGGEVVVRLAGSELLGRKGRSLPGCHTDSGILIVCGQGVYPTTIEGARLEDVAPVVSALAGVPAASWFVGSSPHGLPKPIDASKGVDEGPGRPAVVFPEHSLEEERVIAERLRRLGYLD